MDYKSPRSQTPTEPGEEAVGVLVDINEITLKQRYWHSRSVAQVLDSDSIQNRGYALAGAPHRTDLHPDIASIKCLGGQENDQLRTLLESLPQSFLKVGVARFNVRFG